MGTRSPDAPDAAAPRRGKKAVRRDVRCKAQIGRGAARVVRSGVAALCPDELRFHTGRTGRQGEDLFVHIRFEHIARLVADGPAGTLLVVTAEGDEVIFHLGRLAVPWKQIIEERPDLLRELGVDARSRVAVVAVDDELLLSELSARVPGFADSAGDGLDVLFAGAEHRADLARLPALAARVRRGGVVWVVYPQGSRTIEEDEIVAAGRAAGLVDGGTVELSPGRQAMKLAKLGGAAL
jgi:hypothetical protein